MSISPVKLTTNNQKVIFFLQKTVVKTYNKNQNKIIYYTS